LWWLIATVFAASFAYAQTDDTPSAETVERAIREGTPIPSRATEDPSLRNLPPPLSGPVDPKVYRVGPGDMFQIQVSGRVTRNWTLTVGPEGYLLIPSAGGVQVSGRVLTEARSEVAKVLQGSFQGVRIEMRLARPRTFRVYLTGQVNSPGPIEAIGSNRVADVLRDGAIQGNGSKRRISVTHIDGTREPIDLVLFARMGDQSSNPWLRDGDIINVPVATGGYTP
jgi:polysaccharide export outer membrane protein